MSVVYAKGDLFLAKHFRAFAHGCNCAGTMGKGIAVVFRQRWPNMYQEYQKRCVNHQFQLGEVFHWQENGCHIFNLGTQKHWRSQADINAIQQAMTTMLTIAEQQNITAIALPRIGAGLGGLEWQKVKDLIQRLANQTPITLLVLEEYLKGVSPIY